MSYVLNRTMTLVRALVSPRALLLGLAALAGLGAFVVSSWLQVLAYLVAAAALGLAVLLTSVRQSEHHRRLAALQQEVQQTRQAMSSLRRTSRKAPNPPAPPIEDAELDEARRRLATVRAALGISKLEALQAAGHAAESPPRVTEPGSPAVTIVVPLYNEERHIGEALESIRMQTFVDWECIVIDDASTDRSVAEAWRYVAADRRFRLIRHKVNGGLSAARNTGLRAAAGEFVAFLDADDMFMADNLVDRLEALRDGDSDTAGSYGGVQIVPNDTTLDSLPDHAPWSNRRLIDFVSVQGECPFNAHAPLVRTAIVRDHGGFDETMRHGAEDWDLWLRILRNGYTFVPASHKTAIYRQKPSSMAKAMASEHVAAARRLIGESFGSASESSATAASYPFAEPLPFYLETLTLAKRAIEFASMALIQADADAAAEILDGLPAGSWVLISRHVNVDDVVMRAFHRALGLGTDRPDRLREELEGPRELMLDIITSATSGTIKVPDRRPRPSFDVVMVPQNAAQATHMLQSLDRAADRPSVAFLLTDRVSGEQGAAAVLDEAPYPVYSLNQWSLFGASHRKLVVMFPYDGAVEELIATTSRVGGEVISVRTAGEEVLRSEDAPEALPDPILLRDLELRLTATNGDPTTHLAEPRTSGPMVWARTDDDPDRAYVFEEKPQLAFDAAEMVRFKDRHIGERCVVIGNGPSLNQLDLTKLANEYTIGVNGIFYAHDQMGFDLSYYVVEDTMVVRDNLESIRGYRAGHKFFPSIYRTQIGESEDTTYFTMNRGFYAPESRAYCVPRFSTDAAQRLYSGQSVTIINLQLAYYMGFEQVVMIGMDFSYQVPADSEVAADGIHITSMGDDPNHFHPEYFGKGKVWKDPMLDRVLANYQLAKDMYEAGGRQIVNATPGGKLELFDRVDYNTLFR